MYRYGYGIRRSGADRGKIDNRVQCVYNNTTQYMTVLEFSLAGVRQHANNFACNTEIPIHNRDIILDE